MTVEVRDIHKAFNAFPALGGVSLAIADKEFVALLGPSGSGKTSLLRVIAGLEYPDRGQVLFDGRDVTGVAVRDRNIGFVFQSYALFRHMTVADNIGFGLSVERGPGRQGRSAIARRVEELLELVQLPGLGGRYPTQLSGGQRQRVALARALARRPRLLLLDEPFGALDAKVRKELRSALRVIHAEMGLTSVFVTHDQDEAFALADRVAILADGRIEQVGTPQEVRTQPASAFVRTFLGD
jgi:sulfate transport system ATP-binding protein